MAKMRTKQLIPLLLILASCRGPLPTITTPEHNAEGQATSIEVPPDSLADPCDSLLAALQAMRTPAIVIDTDTVHVHDTVYIQQQRAKAQRAAQAIREAVCQWEDIYHEDSTVVVTIVRGADGTPRYTVSVKERTYRCNCKDQVVTFKRQRNMLFLLLVIAVLLGIILLKR